MNANKNNIVSFEFAVNEMRTNKANIQAWAQDKNNPLLSALANEVLQAAQAER